MDIVTEIARTEVEAPLLSSPHKQVHDQLKSLVRMILRNENDQMWLLINYGIGELNDWPKE